MKRQSIRTIVQSQQEAENMQPAEPQPAQGEHKAAENGNTVLPHPTALPQNREEQKPTKKEREKVTFYLEQEQAQKLYDMMEEFRRKTGIRINQQNMLRRILDLISPDAVLP
jgi:hypothetical protein